jgi:hypothetical protein
VSIAPLTGSFSILYLYDVCEEIDLDKVRQLLGPEKVVRESPFRQPAPEYVRFEKPPIVQRLPDIGLQSGEQLSAKLAYYDYGVVCLILELPLALDWKELVSLSSRWISAPDLEAIADRAVQERLGEMSAALVKPTSQTLTEDYFVIRLDRIQRNGRNVTAEELLQQHRAEISQIVRGESALLSNEEQNEILQAKMSYYPDDLLVVGWTAALIYDSSEGAVATIQLLTYANTQLLEFRHYDQLLTRKLAEVYKLVDEGTGLWKRWRLAKEAENLNTIRLEVRELTERADTAIKFLSDMFAARLYRLAATKVGVPDYRELVDEKLVTAAELYQHLHDGFHKSTALLLEGTVVLILIIELVHLFRGKG